MLIAIVDAYFAPESRTTALNTLLAEAPEVAAMAGNRSFRPFSDPARTGHVGVLHEWESEQAFRAYLASEPFARSGRALRPLMVRPPESRRFSAELLEAVA